jgi:pyruvate dehydrogenase E2 component (dihydrolipoamide acetyltransferase)
LRGVRRAIAEKLTTSRREIPDASTWVDVDATGLMAARDEIKAVNAQAGIGVMALLARISVAGLKRFPELNARVDVQAQEIVQLAAINLSFAAQSPRGLVVPVIHGAGEMTTTELAAALRELTGLARDGKLSPAQMTGGTFTLNNYGVFGTDGATPIINYPEAAMLGIGRIIDRPWAHEGQVALRKVAQLGFTFDHRVCDGGTAGGFLRFVADCVERPMSLLGQL